MVTYILRKAAGALACRAVGHRPGQPYPGRLAAFHGWHICARCDAWLDNTGHAIRS